LGYGPLFGKAHFAEALDLDRMQGFKNHASEVSVGEAQRYQDRS
jgi:hypothetical protein